MRPTTSALNSSSSKSNWSASKMAALSGPNPARTRSASSPSCRAARATASPKRTIPSWTGSEPAGWLAASKGSGRKMKARARAWPGETERPSIVVVVMLSPHGVKRPRNPWI